MAAVETSTAASDTGNQDDATPSLSSHAFQTGLGNNEGATGVDLHHFVPVELFDVLHIADPPSEASVGDQD